MSKDTESYIERVGMSQGDAETIASDPGKVDSLVEMAVSKALSNRGAITRVWDDFMTVLRMLRCRARGEYREVPWQTVVMSILATSYFLNPLDLLPDPIPFGGFIDDITVLGLLFASIKNDIERFRAWEATRQLEIAS